MSIEIHLRYALPKRQICLNYSLNVFVMQKHLGDLFRSILLQNPMHSISKSTGISYLHLSEKEINHMSIRNSLQNPFLFFEDLYAM